MSNPNFTTLLDEAVNKPGSIMKAYTAFHNYSLGNQILAMVQCQMRGIELGPINTFPKWQDLGRHVTKGAKALTLCMPVTIKRKETNDNGEQQDCSFTTFVYKARWFALAQTEGKELDLPQIPSWDIATALSALKVEQITFTATDGNLQGYARKRSIAVSPIAQLPHKTRFHELAHVMLGHTSEADFNDAERTAKNLREVEAESVALLCCEALNLEGAEFCRGYVQEWLKRAGNTAIPERSAQKILRAADQILKAGIPA
ncbi:MAG TPA: ArdC family protein [Pyrinomonadaceae bacterium]|jgi:antirestriction protein ArdC|nr:ArdC family protein [Pyrinomonadaceae bacterium]